jgi:hypothetical protein
MKNNHDPHQIWTAELALPHLAAFDPSFLRARLVNLDANSSQRLTMWFNSYRGFRSAVVALRIPPPRNISV